MGPPAPGMHNDGMDDYKSRAVAWEDGTEVEIVGKVVSGTIVNFNLPAR